MRNEKAGQWPAFTASTSNYKHVIIFCVPQLSIIFVLCNAIIIFNSQPAPAVGTISMYMYM